MNISEHFIRRPIATSLIMAGIAMFGVIAYRALPVSDLPQVDYPTITVNASLPGANPDTMASAVATPLERQFTTIAARYGPFDVAMLEIGQYHPSWGQIHLGPDGALAAHAGPEVSVLTPMLGEPLEPREGHTGTLWWRALPPIAAQCP